MNRHAIVLGLPLLMVLVWTTTAAAQRGVGVDWKVPIGVTAYQPVVGSRVRVVTLVG